MLIVDPLGRVQSSKIQLAISRNIEAGDLSIIHGIVVHQTASATAQATLNGYKTPKANGAHFLIDKDGTIYQTASLYKKARHVGFIKSRCMTEKSCSPADLRRLKGRRPGAEIGRVEIEKSFPNRYPSNADSIGVEIVSLFRGGMFESITQEQQKSLRWLLDELTLTLRIHRSEIHRHSEISWKQESEAASAELLDGR